MVVKKYSLGTECKFCPKMTPQNTFLKINAEKNYFEKIWNVI